MSHGIVFYKLDSKCCIDLLVLAAELEMTQTAGCLWPRVAFPWHFHPLHDTSFVFLSSSWRWMNKTYGIETSSVMATEGPSTSECFAPTPFFLLQLLGGRRRRFPPPPPLDVSWDTQALVLNTLKLICSAVLFQVCKQYPALPKKCICDGVLLLEWNRQLRLIILFKMNLRTDMRMPKSTLYILSCHRSIWGQLHPSHLV